MCIYIYIHVYPANDCCWFLVMLIISIVVCRNKWQSWTWWWNQLPSKACMFQTFETAPPFPSRFGLSALWHLARGGTSRHVAALAAIRAGGWRQFLWSFQTHISDISGDFNDIMLIQICNSTILHVVSQHGTPPGLTIVSTVCQTMFKPDQISLQF